jgi:superfamily I DNA/RNA helicase
VDAQDNPSGFSDFAILFRTAEQGRFIQKMLTKAGIPCQLANRQSWLQKGSVAKLVAVLRILTDQGSFADLSHLNDVLNPSISKETQTLFKKWAYTRKLTLSQAFNAAVRLPIPDMSAARQQRLVALIRSLEDLKTSSKTDSIVDAASRIIGRTFLSRATDSEKLRRFIELAETYQNRDFLSELALNKDVDFYWPGAEKVALMTMHASKGLEFSTVFIAGCEADLIPYCHPGQPSSDLDEERRLFYVAMTRAKARLFLSWSAKRTVLGRNRNRRLSPFVESIAGRFKEKLVENQPKTAQRQLSLF